MCNYLWMQWTYVCLLTIFSLILCNRYHLFYSCIYYRTSWKYYVCIFSNTFWVIITLSLYWLQLHQLFCLVFHKGKFMTLPISWINFLILFKWSNVNPKKFFIIIWNEYIQLFSFIYSYHEVTALHLFHTVIFTVILI